MTFTKSIAAAIAGLSLVAAPVAASAAPTPSAAKLSLSRAGAPTIRTSKLSGGTSTLINIGILAALVAIVLVATSGGDDSPNSP